MQTKHIEELEELKGHEWKYHGKKFLLTGQDYLVLKQTDTFDNEGLLCCISLRFIGLENLTELEFYGLKVVLNEKPKLTRKERVFLEMFDTYSIYIARNCFKCDGLRLFNDSPDRSNGLWYIKVHSNLENDNSGLMISSKLFPFITWESGKAWSKEELMELEVVE